ncbi:hypothetical protein 2 [Wenzhou picorna-like virus 31]|uniref:hypothetical protein 2 n=1 Tax=Wenzhou picorna-like virus 31 TaxID=1923617 RepID=UPI0009096ADF|nr:hypothetical protein 2 [Wenzhou picorna-like virus 31]APG78524.1 hypothetical protein 2 [Wenzhou picorna-like virus 31]
MVSVFGQPSYNRMDGAKGFRATLCFKVVVTATPFHQGVAALSFQYGTANMINGRRGNFPYLATNLPHVKIDVAEQTSVELRVPYLCASEYFPVDVTAQDGFANNYGTVALTRLTNFRLAATQTAVRYSIYTWLEDVELIGAYPFETASVLLQSGGSTVTSELRASKLISRGLGAVSSVASSLASYPSLSAVMGSTAWFTRAAAGLASSFGFSRPVDETIVRRKAIVGYMGESHVDMPSSAFKAAPFQSNTLAVGSVGGNGLDEMSFNFILSKPAMIYRKRFSSAAAVGDNLYAGIVSPSCFWYRDDIGSGNNSIPPNATLTTSCFAPSHLMYIGSNFRYWRGGFKYTFQFSKSKMHGGRVVISYVPGTAFSLNGPISNLQDIPVAGATGVQMTAYTKMFDLRDSSTVEFEVPYINESPYTLFTGCIGTLSVQVVSPLNSPSTAADSVDMLVYVEALPDFEFAGLCPSMLDATSFRSDNTASGVYVQAGGVASSSDASQYVIGEKFRSVKQLAMIPDWHVFDQANATALEFTLGPWFRKNYLPIITGTTPIANTASAVWYGSKCGRMQEMFAFVYGSTEWTAITDDPDGAANGMSLFVTPTDGNNAITGAGSLYNRNLSSPSGHIIYESRGALRTVVPPFSKYQRIPHYAYNVGSGTSETINPGTYTVAGSYAPHLYTLRVRNNTGVTRRIALGRAAADNATMGQYIGPPLCNYFQATASTPPNPSVLPF